MLEFIRREWRLLCFGMLFTFWSSPGQTFFVSLFSGELRSELGLSHGQFGNIYSLGTLISAAVIVWTGPLIDRIDLRWFSQCVILGLAAGCVCLAFASGPWSLLLAVFLLRQFGQSLMITTASTSMVRYLGEKKGSANAISGMGYRLAESLLPAIVIAALSLVAWRDVMLGTALLALMVLTPAVFALLRSHASRHSDYQSQLQQDIQSTGSQQQWRRHEVLRDPRFYLLMPAASCGALLFTGFIFHQVYLVEFKGWTMQHWGYWFVAYGIISTVAALIAGGLVDRFGAKRLLPWIPVPIAAALFVLATLNSGWSAGLFLGLMSITTGMTATSNAPLFSELYGTQHLGSIKSATTAIMVFASALSPALFGWCLDAGISLNQLAMSGALYAGVASILALIAVKNRVSQRP